MGAFVTAAVATVFFRYEPIREEKRTASVTFSESPEYRALRPGAVDAAASAFDPDGLAACATVVDNCADGCVLVTGTAGFIGAAVVDRLTSGEQTKGVIGIDSINSYYDPSLKLSRLQCAGIDDASLSQDGGRETGSLELLASSSRPYCFLRMDLASSAAPANLAVIFNRFNVSHVIHLAAQAGVRYSLEAPDRYIASNINGFFNVLDAARLYSTKDGRHHKLQHFVYASSSSIYGRKSTPPFTESNECVNEPVSLYAATKKSNEEVAHAYASAWGLPSTGLRFFTVYGPAGRPDMALMTFVKAIWAGKPVPVYDEKFARDFTYVDDVVAGILCATFHPPVSSPEADVPSRVMNIGRGQPFSVAELISEVEDALGMKAVINKVGAMSVDVQRTWANVDRMRELCDYTPRVSLKEGVRKFVDWYRAYEGHKTDSSLPFPC